MFYNSNSRLKTIQIQMQKLLSVTGWVVLLYQENREFSQV